MRRGLPYAERVLKERKLSAAVGDEGGFAPDVQGAKEALAMMAEAVKRAGYTQGGISVLP